jgi:hypothetical protein
MGCDGGATICDFCGQREISLRDEDLAFHQWTNRGYVFCNVRIPMRTCDGCGSRNWGEEAEAIIEEAVIKEYNKLP